LRGDSKWVLSANELKTDGILLPSPLDQKDFLKPNSILESKFVAKRGMP